MACHQLSLHHIPALWRNLGCVLGARFLASPTICNKMWQSRLQMHLCCYPIAIAKKGYSKMPTIPDPSVLRSAQAMPSQSNSGRSYEVEKTASGLRPTDLRNHRENTMDTQAQDNRVMLIDGTSIMYRSYYKLLARLHHSHLEHADGNGDWVLTIFTALSFPPSWDATVQFAVPSWRLDSPKK